MRYVSVQDTANKWGLSTKMVSLLCRENRIAGVEKISGVWIIPDDAQKPYDEREQLPATASFDGWPTVIGIDAGRSRPTMTLKEHKFCFNSGFFRRFPETTRIDILCCEDVSELLIRPCQTPAIPEEDRRARMEDKSASSFQWCYIRNGKRTVKIIQNRMAVLRIYAMSHCPPSDSCRFLAYRVEDDPMNALRINLRRSIGFAGTERKAPEPPFDAFIPIV